MKENKKPARENAKEKYVTAMLIDGNNIANYLHHELIKKVNLAHVILSFHDGEYAYGYLEFLSRDPRSGFPIPDYLFIEVDLPGKTNGYELLKRINDNLPFDHFKVVFVTEAPCDSHFLKSTKFPAVGYIHKPLTEDHVRNLKIHTNDETQNSK